jgi:hypothetical protein
MVALMFFPLLLLVACSKSDDTMSDPQAFTRALARAEVDPRAATELCLDLGEPRMRAACMSEVAPRLAKSDRSAALTACAALGAPHGADCTFRLAETLGDSTLCAQAGEFADDCHLHLFSEHLRDWIPAGARPGNVEAVAASWILDAGLSPDDPRAWSAVYRWVLGQQRPLDRASCDNILDAMKRDACRMTALAHYNDLLNHLRDKGEQLCQDPLPPRAQFVEDPDLRALLIERRSKDLCDPNAVRPAPAGGLPGAGG